MAMLRSRLHVEELIGPDTVNTMPRRTIAAFADRGEVRAATLTKATGVQLFEQPFAQLLDELEVKVGALRVGART